MQQNNGGIHVHSATPDVGTILNGTLGIFLRFSISY